MTPLASRGGHSAVIPEHCTVTVTAMGKCNVDLDGDYLGSLEIGESLSVNVSSFPLEQVMEIEVNKYWGEMISKVEKRVDV